MVTVDVRQGVLVECAARSTTTAASCKKKIRTHSPFPLRVGQSEGSSASRSDSVIGPHSVCTRLLQHQGIPSQSHVVVNRQTSMDNLGDMPPSHPAMLHQGRDYSPCSSGRRKWRGRGRTSRSLVQCLTLAFFLCLFHIPSGVWSLSCDYCDRSKCPAPKGCAGGVTVDICGCCKVCAKTANQTCGGKFSILGRCDQNLACIVDPEFGSSVIEEHPGMCQAIPRLSPSSCAHVECRAAPLIQCPADSVPVTPTHPNQCCPSTPRCECLRCHDDLGPACVPGYVRVLVSKATELPGYCCNIYECKEKEHLCADIVCDVDPAANVTCAEDSFKPEPLLTQNGCCLQHRGCVCQPEDRCPPLLCPPGTQTQVTELATRLPGHCCPRYQCVNMTDQKTCMQEGVARHHGSTWTAGCNECSCVHGIALCRQPECPVVEHCSWMGVPEGECCPICRGCVAQSGAVKQAGERWKDDEHGCVTCACIDGHKYCQAELCIAQCPNPRRLPGRCCPICDDTPVVTVPAECPALDSCRLQCESGLQQDGRGCYLCQCRHPTPDTPTVADKEGGRCLGLEDCDLFCPQGYVLDDRGCSLCQCRDFMPSEPCNLVCPHGFRKDVMGHEVCECESPRQPTAANDSATSGTPAMEASTAPSVTHGDDEVQPPTPSSSTPITTSVTTPARACPALFGCMKECMYGFRIDQHGCHKCKCRKCPPPENCTKKCADGFVYNNKGCKLCKCTSGEVVPPTPAVTTSGEVVPPTTAVTMWRCMSVEGMRMEEGQSWYDGCRRCFCHQGIEMCEIISCPMPQCINPIIRIGDCCPSCGNEGALLPAKETTRCLSHDGRHFTEGETWKLDSCTQCICHNGHMLCEIESCPPVLCHYPIYLPDRCCPLCPDKKDVFTIPPLPWSSRPCRSPGGMRYNSGDTWRVSPCQSCMCHDAQMHCFSQTCSKTTCNKTILKKGQCCPYCIEPEKAFTCGHNGETYGPGESWLIGDCTKCICYQGQIMCTELKCDSPATKCDHPIHLPGLCCPLCSNSSVPLFPWHDSPDTKTNSTELTDDTEGDQTYSKYTGVMIGLAILAIFLIAIIAFLLFLLWRSRQRKKKQESHMTQTCHGEVARRPKSTNLEYQGVNPLLGELGKLSPQPTLDYASSNHRTVSTDLSQASTYYEEQEGLLHSSDKSKFSDLTLDVASFEDNTLQQYHNSVEDKILMPEKPNLADDSPILSKEEMMNDLDYDSEKHNQVNDEIERCLDISSQPEMTENEIGDRMDTPLPPYPDCIPPEFALQDVCKDCSASRNNQNLLSNSMSVTDFEKPSLKDKCVRYSVNDELLLYMQDPDRDAQLSNSPEAGKNVRFSLGDERTTQRLLDVPNICDTSSYRKSL